MPRNIALVIGVNQYKHLPDLKQARKDAIAFSQYLETEANFNREKGGEIFLFVSEPEENKSYLPESSDIDKVLREDLVRPDGTGKLTYEDSVWFFFSGHGVRHEGKDYLMPYNAHPAVPSKLGLDLNEVVDYLKRSNAGHIVLVIDACRSEGKKGDYTGFGERLPEGVTTIFSCAPGESSYEISHSDIHMGSFTYILLKSFEEQTENNKPLTIKELEVYLQREVLILNEKYGKDPQRPHIRLDTTSNSDKILLPQFLAFKADVERRQELESLLKLAQQAEAEDRIEEAYDFWRKLRDKTKPGETYYEEAQKALDSLSKIAASGSAGNLKLQRMDIPEEFEQLRIFLAKREWKNADSETYRLLLKAARWSEIDNKYESEVSEVRKNQFQEKIDLNKKLSEYLRYEQQFREGKKIPKRIEARLLREEKQREQKIKLGEQIWEEKINAFKKISNDTLKTIDELWVQASGGQFGFSVQAKIYAEVSNGRFNHSRFSGNIVWQYFAARLGWMEQRDISYLKHTNPSYFAPYDLESNVTLRKRYNKDGRLVRFDSYVPKGHLPTPLVGVYLLEPKYRLYFVDCIESIDEMAAIWQLVSHLLSQFNNHYSLPELHDVEGGVPIAFRKLDGFLSSQKWVQADRETEYLIRALSGISYSLTSGNSIEVSALFTIFPPELRLIDALWLKYTKGHFGFSVQKKIYLECNGQADFTDMKPLDWKEYWQDPVWKLFRERVGWEPKDNSNKYEANLNAPKGYLPSMIRGVIKTEKVEVEGFLARLRKGKEESVTKAVIPLGILFNKL
jgi:uncharacterized caspase-like protein